MLGFSVVEVIGLLVVVTVPLPCGVVVVLMLPLLVVIEEVVGWVVVVVPLLGAVVVVWMLLLLLVVIEEEDVGLEDVLLEPVVLTEVDVFVLELEKELDVEMCVEEEEVERLVDVVVPLLRSRSWNGRARADPARAAVNRANEKCMLSNRNSG